MGLNFSEDLFFWSSPNFGQKMGLIFSEDIFFWSSPEFGQKMGLNFSEDHFFWSSPNIGQKMGLNFSEDHFFWSSPNIGQKMGLNFSEDLFYFGLWGPGIELRTPWKNFSLSPEWGWWSHADCWISYYSAVHSPHTVFLGTVCWSMNWGTYCRSVSAVLSMYLNRHSLLRTRKR